MRISPLAPLLGLLLLGVGVYHLEHRHVAQEKAYQERIAQLEKDKKRIQTLLQRKDREKKQALALAESRSEELWDELHNRDQQMEQLWKAVGKTPKSGTHSAHRGATSSRGRVNPLALKRRYAELYNAVEGRQGEMVALKKASADYRREKLRQARRQALVWSTVPNIYPCQGMLTSSFGYRIHPVMGYARFHSGVDLGAGYGAPIVATAAGRVTCAGWLGGYGQAVTIDHGKSLSTLYGHCSSLSVSTGQYVRKGQVVGYVGSTGMSTGPHLHYEVRLNGNPIDPVPYLR